MLVASENDNPFLPSVKPAAYFAQELNVAERKVMHLEEVQQKLLNTRDADSAEVVLNALALTNEYRKILSLERSLEAERRIKEQKSNVRCRARFFRRRYRKHLLQSMLATWLRIVREEFSLRQQLNQEQQAIQQGERIRTLETQRTLQTLLGAWRNVCLQGSIIQFRHRFAELENGVQVVKEQLSGHKQHVSRVFTSKHAAAQLQQLGVLLAFWRLRTCSARYARIAQFSNRRWLKQLCLVAWLHAARKHALSRTHARHVDYLTAKHDVNTSVNAGRTTQLLIKHYVAVFLTDILLAWRSVIAAQSTTNALRRARECAVRQMSHVRRGVLEVMIFYQWSRYAREKCMWDFERMQAKHARMREEALAATCTSLIEKVDTRRLVTRVFVSWRLGAEQNTHGARTACAAAALRNTESRIAVTALLADSKRFFHLTFRAWWHVTKHARTQRAHKCAVTRCCAVVCVMVARLNDDKQWQLVRAAFREWSHARKLAKSDAAAGHLRAEIELARQRVALQEEKKRLSAATALHFGAVCAPVFLAWRALCVKNALARVEHQCASQVEAHTNKVRRHHEFIISIIDTMFIAQKKNALLSTILYEWHTYFIRRQCVVKISEHAHQVRQRRTSILSALDTVFLNQNHTVLLLGILYEWRAYVMECQCTTKMDAHARHVRERQESIVGTIGSLLITQSHTVLLSDILIEWRVYVIEHQCATKIGAHADQVCQRHNSIVDSIGSLFTNQNHTTLLSDILYEWRAYLIERQCATKIHERTHEVCQRHESIVDNIGLLFTNQSHFALLSDILCEWRAHMMDRKCAVTIDERTHKVYQRHESIVNNIGSLFTNRSHCALLSDILYEWRAQVAEHQCAAKITAHADHVRQRHGSLVDNMRTMFVTQNNTTLLSSVLYEWRTYVIERKCDAKIGAHVDQFRVRHGSLIDLMSTTYTNQNHFALLAEVLYEWRVYVKERQCDAKMDMHANQVHLRHQSHFDSIGMMFTAQSNTALLTNILCEWRAYVLARQCTAEMEAHASRVSTRQASLVDIMGTMFVAHNNTAFLVCILSKWELLTRQRITTRRATKRIKTNLVVRRAFEGWVLLVEIGLERRKREKLHEAWLRTCENARSAVLTMWAYACFDAWVRQLVITKKTRMEEHVRARAEAENEVILEEQQASAARVRKALDVQKATFTRVLQRCPSTYSALGCSAQRGDGDLLLKLAWKTWVSFTIDAWEQRASHYHTQRVFRTLHVEQVQAKVQILFRCWANERIHSATTRKCEMMAAKNSVYLDLVGSIPRVRWVRTVWVAWVNSARKEIAQRCANESEERVRRTLRGCVQWCVKERRHSGSTAAFLSVVFTKWCALSRGEKAARALTTWRAQVTDRTDITASVTSRLRARITLVFVFTSWTALFASRTTAATLRTRALHAVERWNTTFNDAVLDRTLRSWVHAHKSQKREASFSRREQVWRIANSAAQRKTDRAARNQQRMKKSPSRRAKHADGRMRQVVSAVHPKFVAIVDRQYNEAMLAECFEAWLGIVQERSAERQKYFQHELGVQRQRYIHNLCTKTYAFATLYCSFHNWLRVSIQGHEAKRLVKHLNTVRSRVYSKMTAWLKPSQLLVDSFRGWRQVQMITRSLSQQQRDDVVLRHTEEQADKLRLCVLLQKSRIVDIAMGWLEQRDSSMMHLIWRNWYRYTAECGQQRLRDDSHAQRLRGIEWLLERTRRHAWHAATSNTHPISTSPTNSTRSPSFILSGISKDAAFGAWVRATEECIAERSLQKLHRQKEMFIDVLQQHKQHGSSPAWYYERCLIRSVIVLWRMHATDLRTVHVMTLANKNHALEENVRSLQHSLLGQVDESLCAEDACASQLYEPRMQLLTVHRTIDEELESRMHEMVLQEKATAEKEVLTHSERSVEDSLLRHEEEGVSAKNEFALQLHESRMQHMAARRAANDEIESEINDMMVLQNTAAENEAPTERAQPSQHSALPQEDDGTLPRSEYASQLHKPFMQLMAARRAAKEEIELRAKDMVLEEKAAADNEAEEKGVS